MTFVSTVKVLIASSPCLVLLMVPLAALALVVVAVCFKEPEPTASDAEEMALDVTLSTTKDLWVRVRKGISEKVCPITYSLLEHSSSSYGFINIFNAREIDPTPLKDQ